MSASLSIKVYFLLFNLYLNIKSWLSINLLNNIFNISFINLFLITKFHVYLDVLISYLWVISLST